MRAASEIRKELNERMAWAKGQNAIQGGPYDYTDSTEINNLMAELKAAENDEWNDIEIVKARRAAWNKDAQSGMKMGDLCAKYGYSYKDKLVAAVKRLGL